GGGQGKRAGEEGPPGSAPGPGIDHELLESLEVHAARAGQRPAAYSARPGRLRRWAARPVSLASGPKKRPLRTFLMRWRSATCLPPPFWPPEKTPGASTS